VIRRRAGPIGPRTRTNGAICGRLLRAVTLCAKGETSAMRAMNVKIVEALARAAAAGAVLDRWSVAA
jgi:hypothetical protein